MLNTDDSWLNPSRRAKNVLDQALEGDTSLGELTVLNEKVIAKEAERREISKEKGKLTNKEPRKTRVQGGLTPTDARNEAPILEAVTEREKVRVLILTRDSTMLEKGSPSYERIVGERHVFFEIHVIVLSSERREKDLPVSRPFDNVWMYETHGGAWWKNMYEAYTIAVRELVFSGGFRPDIVIADDMFEAGIVAAFLSRKFKRPLQLHIHEDFFDTSYVDTRPYPMLYEISVWYLLGHADGIRTKTEFQRQAVLEHDDALEPITEILPVYYDLAVWRDLVPTVSLHERYPQFKFIMLHVSSMRPVSHSHEVLLGALDVLRQYPTVGLVIVGNGPLRADLERQAIQLKVEKQVEFEPMSDDVISYMKTANIFVHLSEDSDEENLIFEAAVSKVPLILGKTPLTERIFVDGESACICAVDDSICVSRSINRYLNENHDRSRFAINASEAVFEQIEQDYASYLEAYRESVERSLVSLG